MPDHPDTPACPIINLGGTARADLLAGYTQARDALITAHKTLLEATRPHRRDYPDDQGLWEDAVAQHWRRIERLVVVSNEIEAISLAIAGQPDQAGTR